MRSGPNCALRLPKPRYLVTCLILFGAAHLAPAVDIQPTYDANITDEQKKVIEKKIELWEGRLPKTDPDHVVKITFKNADLGSVPMPGRPGVEPVLGEPDGVGADAGPSLAETSDFTNDADGRPTGATITINNNAAIKWHNGLEEPVPADAYDLYTVINHELVHALGFTTQNPRFKRNVETKDGKRTYEGGGEGGKPGVTLTPEDEGTHTDPNTHPDDLMNPGLPKGKRRTPSQDLIDILKDDVWKFPTIRGTLSNFDVWNRTGRNANDFKVTLGGVPPGSVGGTYDGGPFGPGTVTGQGDGCVIKWGPGTGQVPPNGMAHFGFTLKGDITPTSFKFEWTFNNQVIGEVPVTGTMWKTMQNGFLVNRIRNDTERTFWVQRRINMTTEPFALEDLMVNSPLYQTSIPVDNQPIPVHPGEWVQTEFPIPAVTMWYDDFDGYTPGTINGQGGWKGWDNVPGAAGIVTTTQSLSAPHSQLIATTADSVREFPGVETGQFSMGTKVYVPTNFQSGGPQGQRGSYFLLLDKYADGGPYHWAVQLRFDSDTNKLLRDGTDATKAEAPLIKGRWVELRVDIDLDADTYRVFYDGAEVGSAAPYSAGVFQDPNAPGVKDVAVVDLYANSSSAVYYDDMYVTTSDSVWGLVMIAMVMEDAGGQPGMPLGVWLDGAQVGGGLLGDMNCDGVVNFGDINPFVLALSDPDEYRRQFPDCDILNGDIDGDGRVSFGDINGFVDLLSGD